MKDTFDDENRQAKKDNIYPRKNLNIKIKFRKQNTEYGGINA